DRADPVRATRGGGAGDGPGRAGGRGAAPGPDRASVPPPARAPARRRARRRPGDRDVQPEGRRRQDHDHHQPRGVAGRARPQGAARRLRPAGLALGRAGPQPPRDGPQHLQPAHAARRHDRRRRRPLRGPGDGPAALQHRPLRGRGAARARGGPRADPAAGARSRDRALRRHPHRLPALARPPDGQRADGLRRRHRAAGVRVLRPARRGAAQADHRQGPRAAQPPAGDRRRPRHDVRRPHPARPGGHGAAGAGLGRHGVPHRHPPHREVLRRHGRRGADHGVRLVLDRRRGLPLAREGGADPVARRV
ncbi:MAG: ParA-like protein, partial [uncultured Nocardioides sp.]